ncbi:hypothetical protein LGQ02_20655 [Bacillus shivajii]|uniref:hypothetical protein n=1 Tax=Bacillus shivajii TaxID=1983719 RepID=UPI001CFAAF65|nr:hypothetical protein [Bacillus shivajii]UCZ53155.1 hypothetical protein LGQ02_20655 [Bacillus shivajii]
MELKQMRSAEKMIDRWVEQQLHFGKSVEDFNETMFVFGNQIFQLSTDGYGGFQTNKKEANNVVVFRLPEEKELGYVCRSCGLDHDDEKAVLECCAFLD